MRRRSSKQSFPPDLTDVLEENKNQIEKNINCIKIGIIESFDSTVQTATIRIATKQIIQINDDGSRSLQENSLMLECPVVVMHGGESHLTFGIQEGDNCIVMFNDRDIDNWFIDGGVAAPNSPRLHDLSDGIAIVGINNMTSSIQNYLENGIRLAYNEIVKIDLTNNNINLSVTGSSLDISSSKITATVDVLEASNQMIVRNGLLVGGTMTGIDGDPMAISGQIDHNGLFNNTDELRAGNGASGTFATTTGTVTVSHGIITSIT